MPRCNLATRVAADKRPSNGNPEMKRSRFLAFAALLFGAAPVHSQPVSVFSDTGNIFIERNGAKTRLTASEMDIDPVLVPNGAFVVYTRQGRGRGAHSYDNAQFCLTEPRTDELRQINSDGTGDKLLLTGRKGEPDQQLCDFHGKQFSSDGKKLYFLTPGWAVSNALHIYDMRSADEHFVMPANDLLVLNFCPNKYKDDLVVLSHRYFLLGGSYDWYWLFDPTGKKELGPLGEFDNRDGMLRQARSDWCARP
jgi:hypothetical protein